MKELSLNILDIAQNSLAAGAGHIRIELEETEKTLSIAIGDDGWGMDEAFLKTVTDPLSTSRTTRKVGLGLPLFKMAMAAYRLPDAGAGPGGSRHPGHNAVP